MNQQGFIMEIVDDRTAKLKMQRHSACAACGKCATADSSESKEILVEVDNTIGAKVGDHVEVSMDNMNVLKAAAMAYIIPLVALLVGTIGTYYILEAIGMTSGVEAISGLVGICLTVICYLYLKKNDKKFRDSREFIPVITRILIDL
ncbi:MULTISPECIES: SoxR reducing system RseC family protein [unclassified Clostridioides]|uniref:SoxR reducing system RseC family protein n=1 Tax=unclassified Clostridioides TaxID=2635829 RepID=UPI001D11FF05|nr:SoxR reducing system RseC family protein [Clostridioides sp. ZZV15-6388]MCC0643797.1 SoxR reducing system RseC family protein [Clostridioides sp. ZZV14-6150]MCC0660938.1 SoxR reducing system RseC family protein [Clostridioides sp. ZZV14-6154]MCC0665005.1 SoxR reducing system RseC family protein [Clostridioides sp. ZZV15-6597]MCC0667900.1 SoxR reducing system RseC family protein [Clostridioides sp. ZZV14-6153]MCC0717572.1 SoxR reducing system RseC family protein [Clostridioides sp. ZZV14-610